MKKKVFRERHSKDVKKETQKEVNAEIAEPKKRGRKKKDD